MNRNEEKMYVAYLACLYEWVSLLLLLREHLVDGSEYINFIFSRGEFTDNSSLADSDEFIEEIKRFISVICQEYVIEVNFFVAFSFKFASVETFLEFCKLFIIADEGGLIYVLASVMHYDELRCLVGWRLYCF